MNLLIIFCYSFNILIIKPRAFLAFFFDIYQVLDLLLTKLFHYIHIVLQLGNTNK